MCAGYLQPQSLIYGLPALPFAPEKGLEAHAGIPRLMICSVSGNGRGSVVTIPTQVTLGLLQEVG